MRVHLVGGFLGSGKTTAIIAAAKHLIAQGQRVGIVTNDQGKYLVDTGFFKLADLPTVEVTGGCFCCNYDDLDARLEQLAASARPDVIFAESVGSCADLVATVIKPLLELRMLEFTPASLSVFADSRLLRLRLLNEPMPFNEDVCYIFDKQIEEAGLLVVNKVDLLTSPRFENLNLLVARRYPAKSILFQNSLAPGSATNWLRRLSTEGAGFVPTRSLDIDYQRYGAGEARLAWLDQILSIDLAGRDGRQVVQGLIEEFLAALQAQPAAIGHVKFLASSSGGGSCKLSFTTLGETGWQARIPELPGKQLSLLVNARVEMDARKLQTLFEDVLQHSGLDYHLQSSQSFHPSQPNPTHRIS
jgi:Ni2+-binding GTPase involved in maturation of urease and hydrogenase